jgi:hypothetical protein
MVRHKNPADRTGYGKLGMLGFINEKLEYGSTCIKLPTESAEMSPR